MFYKIFLTGLVPVIYSAFMLTKTPTLSDALIVCALSAISYGLSYLTYKKETSNQPSNIELKNLYEELEIEKVKLAIEENKRQAAIRKAKEDERNTFGPTGSGNIIF